MLDLSLSLYIYIYVIYVYVYVYVYVCVYVYVQLYICSFVCSSSWSCVCVFNGRVWRYVGHKPEPRLHVVFFLSMRTGRQQHRFHRLAFWPGDLCTLPAKSKPPSSSARCCDKHILSRSRTSTNLALTDVLPSVAHDVEVGRVFVTRDGDLVVAGAHLLRGLCALLLHSSAKPSTPPPGLALPRPRVAELPSVRRQGIARSTRGGAEGCGEPDRPAPRPGWPGPPSRSGLP